MADETSKDDENEEVKFGQKQNDPQSSSSISKRYRANNSNSGEIAKGPSRVGIYDGGGVTEDGGGFRYKRTSIYEPPPTAIRHASLGERSIRRSFGVGPTLGGLIAINLLTSGPTPTPSLTSVEGTERPRRKIRLLGCIGLIIGCVLGSGIFAAPQNILIMTGSSGMTLLVWFVYGLIALVGALCYVELGCTIPLAGGDYVYLNEALGPLPAFMFQLATNFVIIPTVCAILANVTAKNLVNPYVENPELSHVSWTTRLIAIMLIMLVCYINCVSAELTEKLQGWLMIINIGTIFLIVICGLIHMGRFGITNKDDFVVKWPTPNLTDPKEKDANKEKFAVVQTVQALYQASFSYFGYSYVTYIIEDVENPLRTIPIAICISIPLVICVNVFVNFCYLASIPKATILTTRIVASEMIKSVTKQTLPPYVLAIAPTLVAIAVLGGLTSNILTCSRVSYIGGRNGHFPALFAMSQVENFTPTVSLTFLGLLSCVYALLDDISILIGILTYIVSSVNCLVIYGLIYMRYKRPELPRPFKLPIIVPIFYAMLVSMLIVTPIFLLDGKSFAKTLPTLGGAIFVAFIGIPLYYLFVHKGRKFKCLQIAHGILQRFFQKLWLLAPEEEFSEHVDHALENIDLASTSSDEVKVSTDLI